MIDSNLRMIDKQAQIISRMREEAKEAQVKLESTRILLNKYERAGSFYLSMQEQISESEFLQDAWKDFLFALKMASDPKYLANPKEYVAST